LKSDIAKIKPAKFLLTIRGKTQDLKFAVCGRVPGMLESRYGKGCTCFPPFPRPGGPTITCSWNLKKDLIHIRVSTPPSA
jgi:hypothetical protein